MMLRTCYTFIGPSLACETYSSGKRPRPASNAEDSSRRPRLPRETGPRNNIGKPQFLGLVLTPRVLKSGKFLITSRFCLRGLRGTGSVRAETCYVGCSVLSHRACGG